jgi:hypothetical protein
MKRKQYPEVIYRYSKIDEYLYEMLTTNKLWFANPSEFNDPYDCFVCLSKQKLTEEEIRRFYKSSKFSPPYTSEEIEEQIQKYMAHPEESRNALEGKLQEAVGLWALSCFTTTNDHMLMWAHYANQHKGICIGYDSKLITQISTKHSWVKYAKEYPEGRVTELETFVETILSTKSDYWSYENEIRILQREKGLYTFKREAIKEVIFGLKASDQQIKVIMHLMTQLGFKKIKFRQVSLRDNQYKIYFKELSDFLPPDIYIRHHKTENQPDRFF